LTIPPIGDPAPNVLADGTPVFVVHYSDGDVEVFLAASTHAPHGLRQMLGWCPRIKAFDDGMYSSVWDAHGRPQAGPAPDDLAVFEIVERDARTVTVASLRPSDSRSEGDPRVEGVPACSAGSRGFHADTMVFPDLGPASTLADAIRMQPAGMVVIHGAAILVSAGGTVTACDEGKATGLSGCDVATVEGLDGSLANAAPFAVIHGDFLARVRGKVLTDLLFTRGWTVTGDTPESPGYCGSFDVDVARRTDPEGLAAGYGCLRDAFNAGQAASLQLLFTNANGSQVPTTYEVDGGNIVVSRQLNSERETQICSDLVGDDDGTLYPARCQPS
jgi:hypothetical protein